MRYILRKAHYYFSMVRKKYYKLYPELIFVNFLLAGIMFLMCFLIISYDHPDDWHTTSFVIERTAYRYTRSGGVLNIHTVDNRDFNINENDEVLRYQLKPGAEYSAVYSDDFLYYTIKGLSDGFVDYLDADLIAEKEVKQHSYWILTLLISIVVFVLLNLIFIIRCIKVIQSNFARHI